MPLQRRSNTHRKAPLCLPACLPACLPGEVCVAHSELHGYSLRCCCRVAQVDEAKRVLRDSKAAQASIAAAAQFDMAETSKASDLVTDGDFAAWVPVPGLAKFMASTVRGGDPTAESWRRLPGLAPPEVDEDEESSGSCYDDEGDAVCTHLTLI